MHSMTAPFLSSRVNANSPVRWSAVGDNLCKCIFPFIGGLLAFPGALSAYQCFSDGQDSTCVSAGLLLTLSTTCVAGMVCIPCFFPRANPNADEFTP